MRVFTDAGMGQRVWCTTCGSEGAAVRNLSNLASIEILVLSQTQMPIAKCSSLTSVQKLTTICVSCCCRDGGAGRRRTARQSPGRR